MTRESPLHPHTTRLGATFTEFGGWSMPMEYESVLAEHMAVRRSCGWFDVSHLGRFSISGSRSGELLDAQTTIVGSRLEPGRTRYALVLNDTGGIVDDIVVWRLSEDRFVVLPNAANAPAVMARFEGAEPHDLVAETAMVAVQGPDAPSELERMVGTSPSRFRVSELDSGWILAGTGYTGERGGEIIVPNEEVDALIDAIDRSSAVPCGLGARDTLRLEAGLPLWGQDLDADIGPFEAGLGFAVDMDHDFVGRDALDPDVDSARVRFTTGSRRVPRSGQDLVDADGAVVGRVTSGSFSPVREEGIGMGLLDADADHLHVDIRGRRVPVDVIDGSFI